MKIYRTNWRTNNKNWNTVYSSPKTVCTYCGHIWTSSCCGLFLSMPCTQTIFWLEMVSAGAIHPRYIANLTWTFFVHSHIDSNWCGLAGDRRRSWRAEEKSDYSFQWNILRTVDRHHTRSIFDRQKFCWSIIATHQTFTSICTSQINESDWYFLEQAQKIFS